MLVKRWLADALKRADEKGDRKGLGVKASMLFPFCDVTRHTTANSHSLSHTQPQNRRTALIRRLGVGEHDQWADGVTRGACMLMFPDDAHSLHLFVCF